MKTTEIKKFANRAAAGSLLAERFDPRKYKEAVLVAIPNGGVPVALPAASHLRLPIHTCCVVKIPCLLFGDRRFGIGAMNTNGAITLNHNLIRTLGVEESVVSQGIKEARRILSERKRILENCNYLPLMAEKTVIIVDDGLATGYTALAAVRFLRQERNAERIVVAAPVSSVEAPRVLHDAGVEVLVLRELASIPFLVDDSYDDFSEVLSTDVREILREHQSPEKR